MEVRELPWTFISNASAHAWEQPECSLNGTRNVGYSDARKSQGKSDLVDNVLADRECRPAMASQLEVDHLPDELTICDLPEWWVSVERPLTGSGGDVRLMHNGAERTINVGALYYFGMSWPLNLDIDGVLGENLDWGAVVLNEFWELNDELGYYNPSRVKCSWTSWKMIRCSSSSSTRSWQGH